MFYSKVLFVKKGELAQVWIAAHWERKLKKNQVAGVDIALSAEQISNPDAPLALRVSGQLLLGLVRIYSRKVQYLREDAGTVLTKIKEAFAKPKRKIDAGDDATIGAGAAINLPDKDAVAEAEEIPDIDDFEAFMANYATGVGPVPEMSGLDSLIGETKSGSRRGSGRGSMASALGLGLDNSVLPSSEKARREVAEPRDDSIIQFDALPDGAIDFGDLVDPTKIADSARKGAKAEEKESKDKASQSVAMDNTEDQNIGADGLQIDGGDGGDGGAAPPVDDEPPAAAADDNADAGLSQKSKRSKAAKKDSFDEKAPKRNPRKRKAPSQLDKDTEISSADMKKQLADTSDIVADRETLPLTKRAKLSHDRHDAESAAAMLRTPGLARGGFGDMGGLGLLGTLDSSGVFDMNPQLLEAFAPFGDDDTGSLLSPVKKKNRKSDQKEEKEEVPAAAAAADEDVAMGVGAGVGPLDDDLHFPGGDADIALEASIASQGSRAGAAAAADKDKKDSPAAAAAADDAAGLDPAAQGPDDFSFEPVDESKMSRSQSGVEAAAASQVGKDGVSDDVRLTIQYLANNMGESKKGSITFQDIVQGRSRKEAAQKFYQMLVLHNVHGKNGSRAVIATQQSEPFGDIVISKGAQWDEQIKETGKVVAAAAAAAAAAEDATPATPKSKSGSGKSVGSSAPRSISGTSRTASSGAGSAKKRR